MVRDLFRDKESTEFIIAAIPTVLAIKESERLLKALRKESIPCKRIVVNQVGLASYSQSCKLFILVMAVISPMRRLRCTSAYLLNPFKL